MQVSCMSPAHTNHYFLPRLCRRFVTPSPRSLPSPLLGNQHAVTARIVVRSDWAYRRRCRRRRQLSRDNEPPRGRLLLLLPVDRHIEFPAQWPAASLLRMRHAKGVWPTFLSASSRPLIGQTDPAPASHGRLTPGSGSGPAEKEGVRYGRRQGCGARYVGGARCELTGKLGSKGNSTPSEREAGFRASSTGDAAPQRPVLQSAAMAAHAHAGSSSDGKDVEKGLERTDTAVTMPPELFEKVRETYLPS
ncbi:hypothetical protein GGR56DRAFT_487239 [Xylariaceae sp. FL0804]|nr:hypothetical protein GGR56DRAFT_487239 [Xylariaceae sp. FL0804]